jgi:CIC family chloride channel protein
MVSDASCRSLERHLFLHTGRTEVRIKAGGILVKIDTIMTSGRRLSEDARSIFSTAVLSVAAALSSVAFLFATNSVFSITFQAFATRSKPFFAVASLIVIITFSFAVSVLMRLIAPDAAGSGIPQLKAAYWLEMGYVRLRTTIVKFVAGVLSIGGGNSLGREGPSIHVGGGVASNAARLFGFSRRERRGPAVIGAAAALAAAFNTPLAAIAFVTEEILGDFSSRLLGRVVLSSVLGSFVVYALIGRQPSFVLPAVEGITWVHYLVAPFAAVTASLAGMIFQRLTLAWRGRLRRRSGSRAWLLPVAGGFITWIIGITVFWTTGKIGVFGLGYQDLSQALRGDFAWKVAGVMFIAKLLAMAAGYSCGGSGGIFAPSLFIGGMAGYFVAGLAGQWLHLTMADRIVLASVGMSACLGTIVRAPLTSLLIVFEMTHQFVLVPGLLIGLIISQAVARTAGRLNFYDALLVQDGHELHKIHPPVDLNSWQNLPAAAIANPKPVILRSFAAKEMKELLDRHPYANFPVVVDGTLRGVVTRKDLEEAIGHGHDPAVFPAVTCEPEQTIREIGNKFIESPLPMMVVVDGRDGMVRGLITLHDLIRAQAAFQS